MYSCTHFSISTTWTSGISLKLRQFYARPKSFWYPLNRIFSGHHSRPGRSLCRVEQNSTTHLKAPITAAQVLILNQNEQAGLTNKNRKEEKRFKGALHSDMTAFLPALTTWIKVRSLTVLLSLHFPNDSCRLYRSN